MPIVTSKAVVLLHGDASNFDSSFVGSSLSSKVPIAQSFSIYLAKNNVDVWGADRRSTFVPDDYPGTQTPYCYVDGCAFIKTWDTALHVKDTQLAARIARNARGLTGSDSGQLLVLGHSRGAQVLYAYANQETQLPDTQRDLRGMIPVEMVYKFDPQETQLRADAYQRYISGTAEYKAGLYYTDGGAQLKYAAYLAATTPDDPSPILPGLTNKQAALFVVAATYATFAPLKPYVPFYHYLAGTFDSNNIPTGLQFTNWDYVLDLAAVAPSFGSKAEDIEGEALMSGQVDTPYDDYLGQIKIPVFYVGVAGGFGRYGWYTVDKLLGSADKCKLIVQLYPAGMEALDYGHADLLWADNAQALVWMPIYNWIKSH